MVELYLDVKANRSFATISPEIATSNSEVIENVCTVYHVSKPKPNPFDAERAWDEHLARRAERERQFPQSFDKFRTTYPFSRYPLYLVYSKRPQTAPNDAFDPHKSWLDHLDRLADLDRLLPLRSKSPFSPTPIKVRITKATL